MDAERRIAAQYEEQLNEAAEQICTLQMDADTQRLQVFDRLKQEFDQKLAEASARHLLELASERALSSS